MYNLSRVKNSHPYLVGFAKIWANDVWFLSREIGHVGIPGICGSTQCDRKGAVRQPLAASVWPMAQHNCSNIRLELNRREVKRRSCFYSVCNHEWKEGFRVRLVLHCKPETFHVQGSATMQLHIILRTSAAKPSQIKTCFPKTCN